MHNTFLARCFLSCFIESGKEAIAADANIGSKEIVLNSFQMDVLVWGTMFDIERLWKISGVHREAIYNNIILFTVVNTLTGNMRAMTLRNR